MKFLRVPPAKLHKYQHYHDDRDVAWIKLYTSLLDADTDVEYSLLHDSTKLLLHHIWMLAARTKNRIPYNREWISKQKLNVRSSINLKDLLAHGFIEIVEIDLDNVLVPPLDDSLVSHASLGSSFLTSSPKEDKFDFEAIWGEYPRKLGRAEALRHFRAQVKTRADYVALQSAVTNYRAEIEANEIEDRFVKHGSTFFNSAWRDYADGVWSAKSIGKKAPVRVSRPPSDEVLAVMNAKGRK
jgi:hypothetical protein